MYDVTGQLGEDFTPLASNTTLGDAHLVAVQAAATGNWDKVVVKGSETGTVVATHYRPGETPEQPEPRRDTQRRNGEALSPHEAAQQAKQPQADLTAWLATLTNREARQLAEWLAANRPSVFREAKRAYERQQAAA